ncbi:MAG: LuxR C-terminal-related transcriptional regulator [Prevotella sp.]
MKMTILLVDDHPIVLEGMKALLASLPNTTFATATTAIRAREIIDGGVVDVMIADLELGRDSGLALAEYLHEQQPAARVVIYTMHEEAWTIHDILDCEPDAVVMKSDSPAELVKAVKALASGKGYYSQSFCRMLSMTTASPERLSDRELQVLAMTAEGLSTKEAAARLGVSANTIEFHRKRIMTKLNAANAAEMVMKAQEFGWNNYPKP